MSPVPAVLSIDQGTTGTTALVVAKDGRILSRAYSEFTQYFPEPGWVEHDAMEIWEVTRRVSREALEGGRGEARVEAIGITNQRETVVLWDRETLDPVHRAIVWQDRRTASICEELKETGAGGGCPGAGRASFWIPTFRGRSSPGSSGAIRSFWTRAEAGELAVGTVDSWLIARLTQGAVHATDHTNASRTLLYNLETKSWDPELLDHLEVPEAVLPEIRPSSGMFGITDGEELGLEVPVAGVAGDQQAALFGQGCWTEGLAKNTYGTGAFLLLHTGDRRVASRSGLLTTMACDETGGPGLCPGGVGLHRRGGHPVARDGLGILEIGRGFRGDGQLPGLQRRSLFRPGLRGPWGPPLGSQCPGNHGGSDPGDHRGPSGPGGPGGHGLSPRPMSWGHGGGLGGGHQGTEGGWGRAHERLAHGVPGGRSGGARAEAGAGGDHGSGCGGPGGPASGVWTDGGVPGGSGRARIFDLHVGARIGLRMAGWKPSRGCHGHCLVGVGGD